MATLVTIQLEKCEFKARFWTLTQLEKFMKTEQGYFSVAKERAKAQRCSQSQISARETGLPAG